jgi:hypothetical protein
MGGLGSGNRWDAKATTESQHRIDIRWLKKHGYLRPSARGSLSWSCGEEQTGTIGYWIESDHMILSYKFRYHNGEWESVEQAIPFDWTPCNYGGQRFWFLCPECLKRVALLYGAGIYFLCRHCYNLTYSSQQESKPDRLMRKARKIRARLGASADLSEPILFKPKHMHQKTFDRLRREADRAATLSLVIMGQRLGMSLQGLW